MYIYAELWKAKPSWMALSEDERKAYVEGIGPAIGALLEAGVEILGFALIDDDTAYRADYRYLALWKMPDKERALLLEQEVIGAGFHDYFEQVNARGALIPPDVALGDMIAL